MSAQIDRRTVAKGAAWAVPAVTIASAAPASAVSPVPVLSSANTVTFGITNTTAQASLQYRVYSAVGDVDDPPNNIGTCGPEVQQGKSATIQNISETFWLPQPDLNFVNNGSPATIGWSTLARNTALANHTDTNGNTLYAYTSTFTGTPTVSGTNMCLGIQNWISTNASGVKPVSYDAILTGTINGRVQNDSGDDIPLPGR